MTLPDGRFEESDGVYRRWIWVAVVHVGEPENPMRFSETYDGILEEVAEYINDYIEGSSDPDEPDDDLDRLQELVEKGEIYLAIDEMKHNHMTYIDIEQRTMRCAPPTVEEHLDGEDAPDRGG